MPLTPAEVHNVAFKKPPIGKRGYDEEEVDAFLDIVEVELSRLIEENNDLRANGSGPSGRHPGPSRCRRSARGRELAAAREENGRLQSRIDELERTLSSRADAAAAAGRRVAAAAGRHRAAADGVPAAARSTQQEAAQSAQQAHAAVVTSGAGGLSAEDHHAQAVQMLALAQQTADQHLAQSKAEAERLLAEAQANAHATITEAQQQSQKYVGEAEGASRPAGRGEHRAGQPALSGRRAARRRRSLRSSSSARRRSSGGSRSCGRSSASTALRLKSYLESQLRDLDASGRAEPAQSGETARRPTSTNRPRPAESPGRPSGRRAHRRRASR